MTPKDKLPGQLFHVGQEITPKEGVVWNSGTGDNRAPKQGEVVRVTRYVDYGRSDLYIEVTGYSDRSFKQSAFVPIYRRDD